MSPTLLVVDDERSIRFALRKILESEGLAVVEAADGHEALRVLEQRDDLALIISDLAMPHLDGMGLLSALGDRPWAPPLIMITAQGSERRAVEAMRKGALDYFAKPFDAKQILTVVRRNLRVADSERTVRRLRAGRVLRRTMVFESPAMFRVAELVERVADRDVPVLVTGESGTGKELVARALVEASSRAHRPYVQFNCAALSVELAEAELFGHTRGAFTGANTARDGLFRAAEGGSLLLDEVGELHPRVQASLLRVLQERTVRPVGSDRTVPIDVRLIAATHRSLKEQEGFRQDLYYRLNVIEVHVPPLRERPGDIVPMARHFAARASDRFALPETVELTEPVLDVLVQKRWPGNARELRHAVERLVALSRGPRVELEDLELAFTEGAPSRDGEPDDRSLKARVDAFERSILARALASADGNQSETARRLEISRMTLVSKLKKHGLTRSQGEGSEG